VLDARWCWRLQSFGGNIIAECWALPQLSADGGLHRGHLPQIVGAGFSLWVLLAFSLWFFIGAIQDIVAGTEGEDEVDGLIVFSFALLGMIFDGVSLFAFRLWGGAWPLKTELYSAPLCPLHDT
jgi:hypothetical protein